jgi:adenosylcobinamide kinase / adenosylcobinamide-phosphate guanylyltransferase
MSGGITLVTGGARAGKSALAERLAAAHGEDVLYLATAEPLDDEMAARIAAHRAVRPPSWRTLEAPRDPAGALRGERRPDAVLLDCLTLWTSNVLLEVLGDGAVSPQRVASAEQVLRGRLEALLAWQADADVPLIAVTNEVGLGLVPATPLARSYRDLLGKVNQRVADAAEEVFLVVSGLALPMKGLGAIPVREETGADPPRRWQDRSTVR